MSSKKEINATKKYINVKGAREHNLKNIDVSIPKDSITVITGLSGSGKEDTWRAYLHTHDNSLR